MDLFFDITVMQKLLEKMQIFISDLLADLNFPKNSLFEFVNKVYKNYDFLRSFNKVQDDLINVLSGDHIIKSQWRDAFHLLQKRETKMAKKEVSYYCNLH